CQRRERLVEARGALEQLKAGGPVSLEVRQHLATIYETQNEHVRLAGLLEGWLESSRGRPVANAARANLEIAKVRLREDQIFEAFDALQKSFGQDPKNDEAALLLG